MNSDVIGVILAQLDPQSALRLCQTSSKFNELCKRIGALDKKALAFISHEAPLSVPVRNLAESASLIRRGFKTVYEAEWESGELLIPSRYVKFGGPSDPVGFGIEIVGLPPPEGTVVWVFVNTDWDDGVPYALVYSSRTELEAAWNSGKDLGLEYYRNMMEEMILNFPGDERSVLERLLEGIDIHGFIIREVELP